MALYVLQMVFIGILAVTAIFYAVFEIRLFRALGTVRAGDAHPEKLPKVSVLIAARNEEKDIAAMLDSVLSQDYAGEFEVWVADDRSTDSTPAILAEYAGKDGRLRVLTIRNLEKGRSAKKNAISRMIAQASGEILLLTDADCKVLPTWISGMVREFEPGIELVVGHSYIELPPHCYAPLLLMQAVEVLSYRIAGTGGLAMNTPLTSTGNNLAYRKAFFNEVNGFSGIDTIQSGDDDLLLQKIAATDPAKARYCITPETFVATSGKETFKELWEQRKRWASKTIYYSPYIVFILSMIFAFFTALTLGIALALLSRTLLIAELAACAVKLAGDICLFSRGLRIFNAKELFKWFLPVEFIHAPFTVFAVLFGTAGRFTWKP